LEPRSKVRGEIPVIRRAVAGGGTVEITRGCGRGCQFCSPDLLAFRSIPKDRILQEVEVLVRNGQRGICLPTPKTRYSMGAHAGKL
jgi:radical SAM superfamily enzyme YgiQ (UPF0313 family)